MLQTAGKWFGPGAAHRRILAVVVLVELFLFAGFHHDRWHKRRLGLFGIPTTTRSEQPPPREQQRPRYPVPRQVA